MDFDLSDAQQHLLDRVDSVIAGVGGLERAFEVSRAAGYDQALDDALAESGIGVGAPLLNRVLIAQRLAELGLAVTWGSRVMMLGANPGSARGAFAVRDRSRSGLTRYGSQAAVILTLDGANATLDRPVGPVEPVASGFGFPYGRLDASSTLEPVTEPDGPRIDLAADAVSARDAWTLALAAELSGNATAAVRQAADYLTSRVQFGQPLAVFQALRHRIADAAVSAEATKWLVREAAFTADPHSIALAASYAADTAAQLVPDLVQMSGARSFALEFGLHVHTMRLDGLRLELGGSDRLAVAVLQGVLPEADRDHQRV